MSYPDLFGDPLWRALSGLVLGLVAGSFLGALVLRWPRGEGIARGRSHCDSCAAALSVRDLVPLLSALWLRLRCRHCGARIDPAHMLMEAGGAIIGAAAFAFAAGPLAALGWCLLGWIALALAVLDARHFWLPDALTLPLAFLGLTLGSYTTGVTPVDQWIGAASGYGCLLAIALGYRALRGREGLGLGDAKLVGAIGAWTGWQTLPLLLLFASLAGLAWAVAVKIRGGGMHAHSRIALGAFLCLSIFPAWIGTTLVFIK